MTATVAVRERPILFSGPMVRAILADRKTKTRRVVTPQPLGDHGLQPMWGTSPAPDPVAFGTPYLWREVGPDYPDGDDDDRRCPYGQPGDRLWVRETWNARMEWPAEHERFEERWWNEMPAAFRGTDALDYIAYSADKSTHYYIEVDGEPTAIMPSEEVLELPKRWAPSIFMPRWASRLSLEITEVRVERLQEISVADVIAEGIELGTTTADFTDKYTPAYRHLWDSLNAKRGHGWDKNPYVWVLSFRRVES